MHKDNPVNTLPHTSRLPVVFIGHGSPMNALEDNAFTRSWAKIGNSIDNVSAILCISAHWETQGTYITAMDRPRTIHDFYNFPQTLYDIEYPAEGSFSIAQTIRDLVERNGGDFSLNLDYEWGLDHGSWSVLCKMFPAATVPTLQLSIDISKPLVYHYELGKRLAQLRERGVLIIGSGNIVHNLALLKNGDGAYDWAVEFDKVVKEKIVEGDHQSLIDYRQFGEIAELAVPSDEHFIPLLYAIGAQLPDDTLEFSNEQITLGSISMRSVVIRP